jgi:hypothetical protein
MVFSSYEDLMAAVEERRKDLLTLEIDLGGAFSPEHEAAKAELAQAKAMKTALGGAQFLGDNLAELEQRVAETRPEARSVWVQFQKLDLNEWAALMKQAGASPIDQYEKVLFKTFIGVFGEDPAPAEEEKPEGWEPPEPLTTDSLSVSSKGGSKSILPGGALHSVVQNFMAWQNSGGEVSIRPTRSGRV